ncbi:histone H1.8 isoform X1 [Antechinus flavipes]|uniref:histone H1.8 isoform X1 n=1 Tax=Antechinus flavipes TaxID=38775 RepID=UPI002235D798|nr:histone H1.8 isoform X1 [Antechinus flavipes]
MSFEDELQPLHLSSSDDSGDLNQNSPSFPNSTYISNTVTSPPDDFDSTQILDAPSESGGPGKTSVEPKLPSHPPTLQMVAEALMAKGDKHGTSVAAIKFYIRQMYPAVNMKRLRYLLKQALAKGVSNGVLVRPRNSTATGARGRFKLVTKNKIKVTQTKKSRASVKPKKKKVVKTSEAGKVSSEAETKKKVSATKKKMATTASPKKKVPATKKTVSADASSEKKVSATKKKLSEEVSSKKKVPATKKKVSEDALPKKKVPASKKKVAREASPKRKVPATKKKVPTAVKKVPVKASTKTKVPEKAKKATVEGMAKEDSKPKGARAKKDVEEVRAKAKGMKPKAEITKGKKKAPIIPKKVVEDRKAEKTKLRAASEAPLKTRKQKGSPNVQVKSKGAAAMSKVRKAGGTKEGNDESKTTAQNKSKLDVGIKSSTSQSKVLRESDTVKDQPRSKGKKPEASKVFKKTGKSPKGSSTKPASKKVK